jgi:hypothetical protein
MGYRRAVEHIRASATSNGRRDPPEYHADVSGAFARFDLTVVATVRAPWARESCVPSP